MVGDESTNGVKTFAGGLHHRLELGLGFRLRLTEGHLRAAVGVHFAFAGRLDR